MKKKSFFKKVLFFIKHFVLRIPNPKGGLLTPKTQKVTTENVKKIALFYHKARLARTAENSEITLYYGACWALYSLLGGRAPRVLLLEISATT